MNPRLAWPAVALAGLGAVIACVMAIAHVPLDTIVVVASLLVTPVLAALVAGQLGEMKGQQQQIVQQTNGNVTRLVDILERQGQLLANSQPPAAAPDPTESPDKLAA